MHSFWGSSGIVHPTIKACCNSEDGRLTAPTVDMSLNSFDKSHLAVRMPGSSVGALCEIENEPNYFRLNYMRRGVIRFFGST